AGALLIHQRAIDAKGRDGNAAHRAGGQLVMDLPDDRIQQAPCSSTSAPSTPKVVTVMPRTVQEASWSWIC
ncbi:hypothetical protein C7D73_30920, partial [Klebsiella pneumoniae]